MFCGACSQVTDWAQNCIPSIRQWAQTVPPPLAMVLCMMAAGGSLLSTHGLKNTVGRGGLATQEGLTDLLLWQNGHIINPQVREGIFTLAAGFFNHLFLKP